MDITYEDAQTWLAHHDQAFRTGAMEEIIEDYAEDAVLEVHTEGAIMIFTGREEILAALRLSSASGIQTEARRIIVGQESISMQVVDPNGYTLIMSIWELEDGKIKHDLAVIPAPPT